MKAPRIPPMLATIVQAGLVAVDSVTFGERATCPFCGGPVSGYDTRRKVFAVIRENDRERTLRVTVKRFSCRACGRIVNADEPFYPGTRIGSPVIDLCLTLATMMPDNRTAAWLDAMDILVDRTSSPAVRAHACPANPRNRALWCQHPALVNLTFHSRRQGWRAGYRQRDRSSRCLWFPIRRQGTSSPAASRRRERAGCRERGKRTECVGSRVQR